jgi:hypothetical protein
MLQNDPPCIPLKKGDFESSSPFLRGLGGSFKCCTESLIWYHTTIHHNSFRSFIMADNASSVKFIQLSGILDHRRSTEIQRQLKNRSLSFHVAEKVDRLLQGLDKSIDLFMGIVKIQTGPCGGVSLQNPMQRLSTMVARSNRHTLMVQQG